jgi:hypothetical protein
VSVKVRGKRQSLIFQNPGTVTLYVAPMLTLATSAPAKRKNRRAFEEGRKTLMSMQKIVGSQIAGRQ